MAGYIFAPSAQLKAPALLSGAPDPAKYLSSGDATNYPRTNIGNRYPYRLWKSSANIATGTTYVGVDFGAALTLAAIFIDNLNFTQVEIQASTSNTFSPFVGSGTLTVSKNLNSNRYKLIYLTAGGPLAGVSRQFWRILARTGTLFDGTVAQATVGSVAWCGTVNQWSGASGTYDEEPLEATQPNANFAGGGSEPVILGNPYAAVTLGTTPADRADRNDLLTLLSGEGIGRFFVFYRNAGDTSDAYRCRRAADVTVRTRTPSVMEYGNLILEESV